MSTQSEPAPATAVEATGGKKIAVMEIFGPTFQGEGPLAGSKTLFLRLGGCDYRCAKCDSLHAVMPESVKANARYLTAQEIADELIALGKDTGTPWVTLSGGNPCMWDLGYLISLLQGAGYACALETQGTLAPQWITRCQMVVISPKSPGMGEKFEPDKFKLFLQRLHNASKPTPAALKVVVFSQQDFEFALGVEEIAQSLGKQQVIMPGMMFISLGNNKPPVLEGSFLVSQVFPQDHKLDLLDSYAALMEDFVRDPRIKHWRFLPQMHVLAYSNEAER